MSLLMKAGHVIIGAGRKALGEAAAVSPSAEQAAAGAHPASDTEARIELLKRQLSELEQAYAEQTLSLEAREEAAHQRGIDEGVKTGMARAVRDHAGQLDALQAGVSDALKDFRQQLQTVETLALDVTQAALEKIFGDAALCTELVVQTARHHISHVAADSAIGVQVSAADFPESAQLQEAFATLTRHTTLTVAANPQLPSGACLIDLKLGRLDVGLPQQMTHLAATLNALRTGH